MPDNSSLIKLHLYDLSRGLAKVTLASGDGQMDGVWHAGVVVGDTEWYYGHGIHSAAAGRTAAGTPERVIDLGVTEIPAEVRDAYLVALSEGRYASGGFNVVDNNSNHFADDYARFLTGSGIPDDLRDVARKLASDPAGQSLLSFLVNFENSMAVLDTEQPAQGNQSQQSDGSEEASQWLGYSGPGGPCGRGGRHRSRHGHHHGRGHHHGGSYGGPWGRGGNHRGCAPPPPPPGCPFPGAPPYPPPGTPFPPPGAPFPPPGAPFMWPGPMMWQSFKRRGCGGAGAAAFASCAGISPQHFAEAMELCALSGRGRPCRGRDRAPAAPAERAQAAHGAAGDPAAAGNQASGSKDGNLPDAGRDYDEEPSLEDMLRGVLRGVAHGVSSVLHAGDAALEDILAEHHAAAASLAMAAQEASGAAAADAGVTAAVANLQLNESNGTPSAPSGNRGSPGSPGHDFEFLNERCA